MNRLPTGSMPQMISRPMATTNPLQNPQRRRMQGRDYSVDAQSDTLFREWSRVDPAYEGRDHRDERRRLDRGVSEDLRFMMHTLTCHGKRFYPIDGMKSNKDWCLAQALWVMSNDAVIQMAPNDTFAEVTSGIANDRRKFESAAADYNTDEAVDDERNQSIGADKCCRFSQKSRTHS
ncbi:hypothetical protein TELCIR_12570 [Teladorsagia circumcincta]|uniref:Uncharacterized protein n=1 Tax=Teladorsagia circumcincta TaxID=45464 RepID=A0A2G9U644_TELCI|nr:hypothetical protein TELCIR_12570 [Teladorsagia circumcincta]